MKLFLFLLVLEVCCSYKFLVYSPLFGQSHSTYLAKIADTLTDAGHEVTFFVPIMGTDLADRKYVSSTKDVLTIEAEPRTAVLLKAIHDVGFRLLWGQSSSVSDLLDLVQNTSYAFAHTCESLMANDKLLEELRARKYDVGIAEPLHSCGFGIFEYLGIPATIGAASVHMELVSWHLGEPLAPSYVPATTSGFGDQMTMKQRILNTVEMAIGMYMFSKTYLLEEPILAKKLGAKYLGHEELLAKMSYIFTNSNPYLDPPRPKIHKTVEIGGINIEAAKTGKLDKKWDDILSERKYTVYISFGSLARSEYMPEVWKESILQLCKSLPEVTFIWKYEKPTTMADHLPNLYLSPWLPQNALLADKRLSVFITHGGAGSMFEVSSIGKPCIVIPQFSDQPRNSKTLERHGGAIALQKSDLGRPDVMRKAILEILHNDKYTKAAEDLATVLNDLPFTPKELVVRHAEFAAKFGSLKNLDPYGRNLSLVQYYLIDVILLVLVAIFVLLLVVYSFLRWLSRKIFEKSKSKLD